LSQGLAYVSPPCWICRRPGKGDWHIGQDLNQEYPLCWFCVSEISARICDGEHEKCGFWQDYQCIRQVAREEMESFKRQFQGERLGGFKFKKVEKE